MVTASQTSFIPKQSLSQDKRKRPSGSWLLTSIVGIIFALSLLSAGGAFFYERILTTRVADMRSRLDRMRSAFEPDLITELKRLDTRLTTLDGIMGQHVSLSEFFTVLEQNTLQSVRFKQFAYSVEEGRGPKIVLSGEAANYSSVALQSDIFGQNHYFHNPIFSDMTLDNKGNVTFNVTFYLDQELTHYKGTDTSPAAVIDSLPTSTDASVPAAASLPASLPTPSSSSGTTSQL